MDGKMGIGIIGCGGISASHARAYQTFPDECQILAVSDISDQKAEARMKEWDADTMHTDYLELIKDERIGMVSITTPHAYHAPVTIAAANAGIHVLCEKPMAINTGEAIQMIDGAERNSVKLSVIFGQRFVPYNQFLHDRVIPQLGRITFSYLIDFHYRGTAYYDRSGWRGTWKEEGGALFPNQAVHPWDFYQWLNGGVEEAYGYWTNILHPMIETEDMGFGFVRFKNGSYGKLLTTSCCGAPEPSELASGMYLFGDQGQITPEGFSLDDKNLEAELREELKEREASVQYTGTTAQVRDMLDAISEDRDPFITGESARQSLKIINGIHWCGWNYIEEFKRWIYENYQIPRTLEEGHAQRWTGGKLVRDLAEIVRSPEDTLEVPFLS